MILTHLIIYGFAVWRIASLFVREDGPFYMFRMIRELTGITHDEFGVVFTIPDNFFAQLLSCVWCASIWVSLFFFMIYLLLPTFSLQLAVIFAFSTVAIIIDKHITK